MSFSDLPDDLILEIFCKLKYRTLSVILSDKRLLELYNGNKKWLSRNVINSYNWLYTDLSNIQFFIKTGCTVYSYKTVNESYAALKIIRDNNKNLKDIQFVFKNKVALCFHKDKDQVLDIWQMIEHPEDPIEFYGVIATIVVYDNPLLIEYLIEIGRLK